MYKGGLEEITEKLEEAYEVSREEWQKRAIPNHEYDELGTTTSKSDENLMTLEWIRHNETGNATIILPRTFSSLWELLELYKGSAAKVMKIGTIKFLLDAFGACFCEDWLRGWLEKKSISYVSSLHALESTDAEEEEEEESSSLEATADWNLPGSGSLRKEANVALAGTNENASGDWFFESLGNYLFGKWCENSSSLVELVYPIFLNGTKNVYCDACNSVGGALLRTEGLVGEIKSRMVEIKRCSVVACLCYGNGRLAKAYCTLYKAYSCLLSETDEVSKRLGSSFDAFSSVLAKCERLIESMENAEDWSEIQREIGKVVEFGPDSPKYVDWMDEYGVGYEELNRLTRIELDYYSQTLALKEQELCCGKKSMYNAEGEIDEEEVPQACNSSEMIFLSVHRYYSDSNEEEVYLQLRCWWEEMNSEKCATLATAEPVIEL